MRIRLTQAASRHITAMGMIEGLWRVGLWQQLVQLWELIVLVCRFVWDLLRFLGGG
ncbi:hypothetical protein [Paraburkholderia sp.]|uniref:hypothetical protein n=1 Tax=Paraburkholderia sp. TaxID=1926495 RepID=UPI003D6E0399